MANNLEKLNRLRVNAGKSELTAWRASQGKLIAAIKALEDKGFTDVVPGGNPDAQPQTEDPEILAALNPPEEQETQSLEDSAMSKMKVPPEETTPPRTKGKASLARGLDSDPMARQSRARVRDLREAEKKVKLSKKDKRAIKEEAESRKKAPKPEKKAPKKEKNKDEITIADLARELDKDPKICRAKMRRHEDKVKHLHTKGQDRWTFPKSAKSKLLEILK